MSYLILVAGTVGLVLIWVAYVLYRKQARAHIAEVKGDIAEEFIASNNLTSRTIWSIVGTLAITAAMWLWGVQPIQAANEVQSRDLLWLSSFTDEHHRTWNEDCHSLFARFGAEEVYDKTSGRPYTEEWCRGQWQPPSTPTAFTSDPDQQPDAVAPFAHKAVFGDDLNRVLCTQAGDCYSWDDFVLPPLPEPAEGQEPNP